MMFKIRWRSLSLALFVLTAASTVPTPVLAQVAAVEPSVCATQLNDRIGTIIQRPEFSRMRWGIMVQTQDTAPVTLAAHDAERFFLPASNAKLFTTAAALAYLGPQFQIRTSIYQEGATDDGVVLRVVGRGDPGLGDADLRQLAYQLRDRHITHIGQLIVDDHYFRGDAISSTWEWEDIQAGYGAPANSLILNQNRIGIEVFPQGVGQPLRVEWDDPTVASHWQIDNQSQTVEDTAPEFVDVGRDLNQPVLHVRGQLRVNGESETAAVAVTQPTQYFLERFQDILSEVGIHVAQTTIAEAPLHAELPEVARVESVPLSQLIAIANQNSNNLYAETLLRSLGAAQVTDNSAAEAGLIILQTTLTGLGVNPDGYRLRDGSGLSRRDMASPEALVQTLQAMARSPYAADYRASLSVAAINGTLRNSFRDTPIQGRLVAKTGAMTGVAALSGYFTPPNYPPLVFSLLINQGIPNESMAQVPQAIDEILELLTQLRTC